MLDVSLCVHCWKQNRVWISFSPFLLWYLPLFGPGGKLIGTDVIVFSLTLRQEYVMSNGKAMQKRKDSPRGDSTSISFLSLHQVPRRKRVSKCAWSIGKYPQCFNWEKEEGILIPLLLLWLCVRIRQLEVNSASKPMPYSQINDYVNNIRVIISGPSHTSCDSKSQMCYSALKR